jgi:uncharacterized secreted repeat protein (TIGR03808 family)
MIDRRYLVRGGLAAAGLGLLPSTVRAQQPEGTDVTAELQREIDAATHAGRPFPVPAGPIHTTGLRLSDGARLIGVRGGSHIALLGDGPLLVCENASRVSLAGIVLNGGDRKLESDRGLVDFTGVEDLSIADCIVEHTAGFAIRLRNCGGWVERNRVRDIAGGGIYTTHATGLVIDDNDIERCGDNGILVWRATGGVDGTRVSGNRISDIGNASGGTGQFGNAISLFRAGGVIVADNTIRRCAYTAVRNNGGAGVAIARNVCSELGETAIVAEFDFEGCVIAENSIEAASSGIQMVNFADQGGSGSVCSGNIIRHLRPTRDHAGHANGSECAIKVEGDASILGNVIEGAPWVGILVGWGPSLRDVAVSGNVVRDAPIGIGVSVAEGSGSASITGNIIAGASKGAIVGLKGEDVATGDLARDAAPPPHVKVSGNQVS